jgi:Carboxypeptidase regulatory-like domain
MTIRTLRGLSLASGLAVLAALSWSYCRVPQPRLVCAEYAHSQAVVIAKLTAVRRAVDKNDPDGIDGHFYTLVAREVLRGKIGPTFQVWEENSSGRAPFDWKKGEDYVLFLNYYEQDQAWGLDGCGNSGPLSRKASVVAAIKASRAATGDALVDGMVSAGSGPNGVPDVTVRAIGTAFTSQTDEEGRFQMRLPPGRYRLQAFRAGWSFATQDITYEDPSDLRLSAGSCAQVQFNGHERK